MAQETRRVMPHTIKRETTVPLTDAHETMMAISREVAAWKGSRIYPENAIAGILHALGMSVMFSEKIEGDAAARADRIRYLEDIPMSERDSMMIHAARFVGPRGLTDEALAYIDRLHHAIHDPVEGAPEGESTC